MFASCSWLASKSPRKIRFATSASAPYSAGQTHRTLSLRVLQAMREITQAAPMATEAVLAGGKGTGTARRNQQSMDGSRVHLISAPRLVSAVKDPSDSRALT